MDHRLTLALIAGIALPCVASGAAAARVRAGLDVSSTLPLGSTERIADPAFTGRVKAQWLSPNERLIIGVLGGRMSQPHRATGDPTLTGTLVGGEVGWIFGPKDWGTRPYLSLQVGYAGMGLEGGGAQFSPPSEQAKADGMFIIPEAGLAVALTPNFGLRFDFRYEYLRSFDQMSIPSGDQSRGSAAITTYSAQTFGLGAGVIVTF